MSALRGRRFNVGATCLITSNIIYLGWKHFGREGACASRASHAVTVYERNRPGDTFGWGVVFSDQTLGNLALADTTTHREIEERFIHWDDIDIHYRGRCITAGGQGFSGIRRTVLLDILARRAIDVGVDIRYQ